MGQKCAKVGFFFDNIPKQFGILDAGKPFQDQLGKSEQKVWKAKWIGKLYDNEHAPKLFGKTNFRPLPNIFKVNGAKVSKKCEIRYLTLLLTAAANSGLFGVGQQLVQEKYFVKR